MQHAIRRLIVAGTRMLHSFSFHGKVLARVPHKGKVALKAALPKRPFSPHVIKLFLSRQALRSATRTEINKKHHSYGLPAERIVGTKNKLNLHAYSFLPKITEWALAWCCAGRLVRVRMLA